MENKEPEKNKPTSRWPKTIIGSVGCIAVCVATIILKDPWCLWALILVAIIVE